MIAPVAALIDRRRQLLHSHGPIDKYLKKSSGSSSRDVVDMAGEGLRARLRGAIAKVSEGHHSLTVTARVKRGKKSGAVKVTLSPLRAHNGDSDLLLLTFEDQNPD
ncbi:MAG: PAS domain-containing protein, partial [Acidobacteriota bacterium]